VAQAGCRNWRINACQSWTGGNSLRSSATQGCSTKGGGGGRRNFVNRNRIFLSSSQCRVYSYTYAAVRAILNVLSLNGLH
jgi:hypothetical protein